MDPLPTIPATAAADAFRRSARREIGFAWKSVTPRSGCFIADLLQRES
jgi:hypothetical protein